MCAEPLQVGTRFSASMSIPPGCAGPAVVELDGLVQRAGPVSEGWAAYVKFDGIDDHTEDVVLEYLAATSYAGRTRIENGATSFDGVPQ